MHVISYKRYEKDITVSLTKEELRLLRALVIELHGGPSVDRQEFETVSGICNPQLVQELKQQLIEAYELMEGYKLM